jgi:hypothetical protein
MGLAVFLNGGVLPFLISQGFRDGQSLLPPSLSFSNFEELIILSWNQDFPKPFGGLGPISPKTRPTHRRHVVSIISADQRRLPEPLDFDVSGDIDLPAFLEKCRLVVFDKVSEARRRISMGVPWQPKVLVHSLELPSM